MQLIAESLTLARGGRIILARLSFVVRAGESLLVTGPNGAGKTTLLRTVAGLGRPVSGALRLERGDPERTIGEQCHYCGHLNAVKARLSVAENATFWARFLGASESLVAPALARLHLAALADVSAAYLSAGQQRRLGLCRLLLANRAIWLLDEPTVSLDRAGHVTLKQIINAHIAAGGIAIAATHAPLDLANSNELRLSASAEEA
jgi:heme exporter protein A